MTSDSSPRHINMKAKRCPRPSPHRSHTPPTIERTTHTKIHVATGGRYSQHSRLDESRQYITDVVERLSSLRSDIASSVEHTNAVVDAAHAEMKPDIDESFTSIRDWLQRFTSDIEACNDDKSAAIAACKTHIKMFPDVDHPRKPSKKTIKQLRECSRNMHDSIDCLKGFVQCGTNAMDVIADIVRRYNEMNTMVTEMTEVLSKCVATVDVTLAAVDAT